MADDLVLSSNPLTSVLLCVAAVAGAVFTVVVAPLWLGLMAVITTVAYSVEELLRFAYGARVHVDGTIEFQSVLRRRSTRAREVRSIAVRHLAFGNVQRVKVTFVGGSVLLSRSEQTRRFAQRVRTLNPTVAIGEW